MKFYRLLLVICFSLGMLIAIASCKSGDKPEAADESAMGEGAGDNALPADETAEEPVEPATEGTDVAAPAGDFDASAINFGFDSYALTDTSRDSLSKKASYLTANPTAAITISGHCDERGSNEYNLALGERRAAAAKEYLLSLGVPADKISTVSYGEEKTIDPGHGEDAWAKNRRCEFELK